MQSNPDGYIPGTKKEGDGVASSQEVTVCVGFFFLLEDNLNIKMCAHHVQAKAINQESMYTSFECIPAFYFKDYGIKSHILFDQFMYNNHITKYCMLYLQQLLDGGSPRFQQQGQGPGRTHSAGGMGKDMQEEPIEVGRTHSSSQEKGSRKRQPRFVQEQCEKLKYSKKRKNKQDFLSII